MPEPGDGQVLVRNTWMSVDPYMRGRMNDRKSYVPPFQIDAPLEGGAVGEVVASRADGLAEGDTVLHQLGWREYAVLDGASGAQGRHRAGAAAGLPRRARDAGPDRLRRPAGHRRAGRGRRRLRLRRGGRGRRHGGPDRQGARPPGDRQRRLAREGRAPHRRARLRRGARTTATATSPASSRPPRPRASTSTSTTSAASTSRPRSDALNRNGRVAMCGAISQYNATEPVAGPAQPRQRRRQAPDAARLHRQRPRRPHARVRRGGRRPAARGAHQAPRDGRGGPRAGARGVHRPAARARTPARCSSGWHKPVAHAPIG